MVVFYFRYDARVKAMEVDERPTEKYSDIGGLDQQIQEVVILIYNRCRVKMSFERSMYLNGLSNTIYLFYFQFVLSGLVRISSY